MLGSRPPSRCAIRASLPCGRAGAGLRPRGTILSDSPTSPPCAACGAAVPSRARFCASCGVELGAPLVDLARPTGEVASGSDNRSPLRRIAVLIGVAAILVALAFTLFAGDPADNPEAAPTPTAMPSPTPTAAPTPSPTPTPEPVDDTSVALLPDNLPPVGSEWIVLTSRSAVAFLSLESAEWVLYNMPRRVEFSSGVVAVGDSVLFQAESRIMRASPGSGIETVVSPGGDTWLVGAGGDVAVALELGEDVKVAIAYDSDGVEVWRLELPSAAWPHGVTSDGEVVVHVGSLIAAVAPGSEREIARGSAGIVTPTGWLSTWDCTTASSCGTSFVNIDTGERVTSRLDQPFLVGDLVLGDPGVRQDLSSAAAYAFVDGELELIGDMGAFEGALEVAVDESGIVAYAIGLELFLDDLDGNVWTITTPDRLGPALTVDFVDLDG